MLVADCIACQHGDHSGHVEWPHKPPKGVIGGHKCECKGDCAERYAKHQERIESARRREFEKRRDKIAEGILLGHSRLPTDLPLSKEAAQKMAEAVIETEDMPPESFPLADFFENLSPD